ncbi:flagellar biosynthetic protein FlhB [Poseidonocella pacifica]|uniref:Flagellar biosynthetic protein FlhB n=1 Tax=Poseidonocella pacifica TaxID=871651 RepID=A0A1I0XWI7_9RHOB|nr:flagellar type III secretion system protein FlhB [Poseidonocella pacifica]SFB05361.1 flagellar biosynthetic protein FlhB [Poseidonocella pacifica]
MSGGDDDSEKNLDPTPKKLEDARKKGEIAKSADVSTAAVYLAFTVVGAAFGAASIDRFGTALSSLIDRAPELSKVIFEEPGRPIFGSLISEIIPPLLVWFLLPALAALLAVIAQRAFVVAPSKLEPKLSKISPIQGAKNKFGRNGLFEFAKSFAKLTIYSVVLGIFLRGRFDSLLLAIHTSPGSIGALMLSLCLDFMLVVIVIATTIAAVDYAWQHFEHIRKNRMSRKDMMDEMKQSEGDPHMKQQRRQRGHEIAMRQVLKDVPEADVVIVNPTHYAVALKWSRKKGEAPACIAKGVDEIAARIREIAQENAIPIHSDPPTARALYATVQIGQEIAEEHYQAVAAAIRFAEKMRRKVKGQPWMKKPSR